MNSCSSFRLGWDTTLLSPEERTIASPNKYDTVNELELGNYVQRHYIEKEGHRIDFLSEGEEEEHEAKDIEEDISQLKIYGHPALANDIPASSSRTFNDLVSIDFPHPVASPGITLEGLVRLQTPESRIDPMDQSSTSVVVTTSRVPEAPVATDPSHPPASQGGVAS